MNNDPLFWLYADNYRTYNIDVAHRLGSIHAAILLAELASRYKLHKKNNELKNDPIHGDGWFYHTIESVEERTCLTRKNQDSALRILEGLKLIEKKTFGIPPKRYFRLNKIEIQNMFTILTETDKLICPKRTNCNDRNGQIEPSAHTYKEPKEEPKERTLSISHSGSTDSTAKDKSRECVSLFVEKIKEHDPKFKLPPSKQKSWEQEFLAMHKDDDRSWNDIMKLIEFTSQDDWWWSRSLTPMLLRKHSTQLITQMSKNKPKDDPLKSKQNIIDKNQDYTRNAVSFLPQKYFVIYTDTIKFTLETETITLYYEDPNFRNQLKTIIDKINRDL